MTSLQASIEKSLRLIQFHFDSKVYKIAIKPNMCYYWDSSTGETTDPEFIGALIDVIRKNTNEDADISIVESDASAMRCEHAFRMLGYEKLAEQKKIRLVNLANDRARNTSVTVHKMSFHLLLPTSVAEADLFIDVPKIKYMPGVKFSCALKNLFGCNPYSKKSRYHPWLDEVIVGINKVMRPHLCLLDGIIVGGVHPLRLGLVMASTDPVAFDSAAATMAGIDPHSVRHISLACSEGIGRINYINVGVPLKNFACSFPRKDAKYKTQEFISKVYTRLAKALD
jgi:uncharacterized protein (DUF362 family)